MVITYDPEKDIPDLSGKVIFITGGTNGIGRETVLSLASHSPSHIYFTGRNSTAAASVLSAAKETAPSCPVTFLECDLGSRDSLSKAVASISPPLSRLDIFIANAGIMALPAGTTADGYEVQFGTNHMGHAALLKLLWPVMLRTAEGGSDVRYVALTSMGHRYHTKGGVAFDKLKTADSEMLGMTWAQYGQSKLANILYAKALAKKYPQILSVSIHPGVVATELLSGRGWMSRMVTNVASFALLTPRQGAFNTLWAATAKKDEMENGGSYMPVGKPMKTVQLAEDDALVERLWEWTQDELKGVGE